MTNNIFDIFHFVDKDAEAKKEEEAKLKAEREAEAKAKAEAAKAEREAKLAELREKNGSDNKAEGTAASTPAKEVKTEVKFAPNEETVIRFYGESFEITSYFTTEELAEGLLVNKKDSEPERKPLTEELLRKRMEKDFPELVKGYSEIVFIPEKNLIIPMVKAKKKGCTEAEVLLSNDSTFAFPKIPFSILQDFISLAKLYSEEHLEVHADVYYQTDTDTYFLDVPKQVVHEYWVEVTEDIHTIARRVLDAVKVLEIHSHHHMLAIPSKLDNASERVPGMYYAIVGNMNRFFPDVFIRQFISEEVGHKLHQVSELFECPFQQLPTYDSNAIEVSK